MPRVAVWRVIGIGALLITALGLAAPPAAEAQSRGQLRQARELFMQGVAAARDGRWAAARTAFERSLDITERPSTVVNLAAALAQTGQLLEAVERYERFLAIATGRDARLRPDAEEALARVRERIPRLRLQAGELGYDDVIEIDGEAVDRARAEQGVELDPGAHHVAVRRGDEVVFEEHLNLAEATVEVCALTPRAVDGPDDERAAAEERVESALEASTSETGGDDGVAIGVGVGIGAAVAIAAAIVIVVVVTSEETELPYQGNLGGGVIRF